MPPKKPKPPIISNLVKKQTDTFSRECPSFSNLILAIYYYFTTIDNYSFEEPHLF